MLLQTDSYISMFLLLVHHKIFRAPCVLICLLFHKGLLTVSTEDVGVPSQPSSTEGAKPLTPTEMEVLRQHALTNGRWLLGLGKEELRLLGELTGSNIGGDLLQDNPYLDYMQPDFGDPGNPYQNSYPGAPPIVEASKGDGENSAHLTHPTISPDVNTTPYAPYQETITDPSDEDLLFAPLLSTTTTVDSSPTPPPTSNNQQHSSTTTETPVAVKPTVNPLIYPVQFYSQAALSQASHPPHDTEENYNPLAQLAEQYPDNFQGW